MNVYTPPDQFGEIDSENTSIFLAGSIEMGKAEPWQEKVIAAFKNFPVDIYNPRRAEWDASWVQSKENDEFVEQVLWELDNIQFADIVIFYFDPNTTSPITLLELGAQLIRRNRKNLYVCCPEGYFRKGNVDITCNYFDIPVYENLDDMLADVIAYGII